VKVLHMLYVTTFGVRVSGMVFTFTFNNISVIS
jgi:hypothetical protein